MATKSTAETEIALQRMVTIYVVTGLLSGAAGDIPRCMESGFD